MPPPRSHSESSRITKLQDDGSAHGVYLCVEVGLHASALRVVSRGPSKIGPEPAQSMVSAGTVNEPEQSGKPRGP